MSDDFNPDAHTPVKTEEIELTLTVEMYEFEDDDGWLSSRFVVRNNFNDYHTVAIDEDGIKTFWIDVIGDIKRQVKKMRKGRREE